MKKLTFNDLEKGKIYYDERSCWSDLKFKKFRNDQLATFQVMAYDEEKEDFYETDQEVYLTKMEVEHLK